MMTTPSVLFLAAYLLVLLAAVKPLGLFFARLIEGPLGWRLLDRLEARLLGLCGVRQEEMSWRQYAGAVLLFSLVGVITVYALQRLQLYLPLNPQQLGNVTPDSSFNTAVSFVTNTNWQGYGGESTMSYLTQMLALAVQNFLSAAAGIAVVFALSAGLPAIRHRASATSGPICTGSPSTCCCPYPSFSRSPWSVRGWCRTSLLIRKSRP